MDAPDRLQVRRALRVPDLVRSLGQDAVPLRRDQLPLDLPVRVGLDVPLHGMMVVVVQGLQSLGCDDRFPEDSMLNRTLSAGKSRPPKNRYRLLQR